MLVAVIMHCRVEYFNKSQLFTKDPPKKKQTKKKNKQTNKQTKKPQRPTWVSWVYDHNYVILYTECSFYVEVSMRSLIQ